MAADRACYLPEAFVLQIMLMRKRTGFRSAKKIDQKNGNQPAVLLSL